MSLVLTEWIKGSPFLFYLNRNVVTLYKARFPNALKSGNFRISGLTSTQPFPPNSKMYMSSYLELPYLPSKFSLRLDHLKLIENKSNNANPSISYQILGTVELNLNKKDLMQFLNDNIRLDFFDNYFLSRNTPKKEEITQIKQIISSLFERDVKGARVSEIDLSPSRSSSLIYPNDVYVACNKIYEVTIKYRLGSEIREIKTQYGKSGIGWMSTLQESMKHTEHSAKPKT